MEDTQALHHQQELEHQEYVTEVAKLKHPWRGRYEVHVHASDETVFINIGAGVIQTTFFLDQSGATVLLDQLTAAIKELKNDKAS
jgi:hypothetical protein